jgi:hypothetical protein
LAAFASVKAPFHSVGYLPLEDGMTKTRNRKKPLLSFQERLQLFIDKARAAAAGRLPDGAERQALLLKILHAEDAVRLDKSRGKTTIDRSD